jgi:carbamoyl-phosphate synthase small subunit
MNSTYLVLADGTCFRGSFFGAPPPLAQELASSDFSGEAGEVVFNTSMAGYHEIVTDPSYTGQYVVMTYPHIGNYGADESWNEGAGISVCGLIVRSLYSGPLPPGRISLAQYLQDNGIPGISGIDTRRLTLKLRDEGSCNGVIVRCTNNQISDEELGIVTAWLSGQQQMAGRSLISEVGCRTPVTLPPRKPMQDTVRFALLDCGIKHSIVEVLRQKGVEVTLFPADSAAAAILASSPDAVLISNGPGDPAVLQTQISLIRELLQKVPVFGICLGHQLICLALGAETYKMKFGHHGGNHPVRDTETGRVCVTAQNHGFAVAAESLPENVGLWFVNSNDGSVEGVMHRSLPVMSVQFHPEAGPGPHDARWIFDSFITRAVEEKGRVSNAG